MKKRRIGIVVLSALCYCSLGLSQNVIYELHPSVGTTIDKAERDSFYLFDNSNNTEFLSAQIYREADDFKVVLFYPNDTVYQRIDALDIAGYHANIEKILAYHLQRDTKDTTVNFNLALDFYKEVNMTLLTPKQMHQMKKDARRYRDLNMKANRMGLMGVEKEDYIATHADYYIFSPE